VKVKDFLANPLVALQHAERYVNEGSPSGFTALNRTSALTDPLGYNPYFNLCILKDVPEAFEIIGTSSSNNPHISSDYLFIHPDMVQHPDLREFQVERFDRIKVTPTSSSRTVQIINEPPFDYIKLCYDGIVGRNNRRLYRKKAIAGPEISIIISQAINEGVLDPSLSILNEPCAKLHKNHTLAKEDHWGMVWREHTPTGPTSGHIAFMLPFFSFWSIDRRNPEDDIILKQLINIWGSGYKTHLVENILFRVIDIYFEMVVKLGLLFEFNAQNVLVGFDKNFNPISIILRDMMDAEKDLTIRAGLGLNTTFESFPYHVISEEQGHFYQERHSFSFDFKLSGYIIEPIIETASRLKVLDKVQTVMDIKYYTSKWLRQLPENYFPYDGKWYSYDKILIDKEKIHVDNDNPLLR
jgi:hypothetical protein